MVYRYGTALEDTVRYRHELPAARSVGNYDGLSRLEVTDLASLGIGRTGAGRIHRMIQKYGDVR